MKTAKEAFRLMNYTVQKKMNLLLVGIFAALSILFTCLYLFTSNQEAGRSYWVSVYPSMCFTQMLNLVLYADTVKASAKHKKLSTLGIAEVYGVTSAISYTILAIGSHELLRLFGKAQDILPEMIYMIVGIGLAVTMYNAFYFKNPVIGMTLLILVVMVVAGGTGTGPLSSMKRLLRWGDDLGLSDAAWYMIGYAGIFMTSVLQFFLSKLTYRMPYSEWSVRNMIRQA